MSPSKTRSKAASAADNTLPTILFKDQKQWEAWLAKNHKSSSGLWIKFAKKDSGLQSATHKEVLEAALCYGWIDGQKRSDTAQTWLQKFVPRGKRSIWSKINRESAL